MSNAHSRPQPSPAESRASIWEMPWQPWRDAADYLTDAAQRSVLFWDVMRQRLARLERLFRPHPDGAARAA